MSPALAPTEADVDEFLRSVPDERRRADGVRLKQLFEHTTELPAVMWGSGIVGFGTLHYRYTSGREGDTIVVGFALRKAAITLYGIYSAYEDEPDSLFETLGRFTTGKGCIYLKRLDDIDEAVLETIVRNAVAVARSLDGEDALER